MANEAIQTMLHLTKTADNSECYERNRGKTPESNYSLLSIFCLYN